MHTLIKVSTGDTINVGQPVGIALNKVKGTLESNKTYTLQFKIINYSSINKLDYIYIDNQKLIDIEDMFVYPVVDTVNSKNVYLCHIEFISNSKKTNPVIKIGRNMVDTDTPNTLIYEITDFQLERGYKTEYKHHLNDLGELKSNLESKINLLADSLQFYVGKNDFDILGNQVSSALGKIEVSANEISLKVEQTDVENAIDELSGAIYQNIEDVKAEIKVTTDSITQRVASTENTLTTTNVKLDELQVGGRNYIPTSGNFTNSVGNWISNGSTISIDSSVTYFGYNTLKIGNNSHEGINYNGWIKLKPNTTYTYSITAKADKVVQGSPGMPLHMWLNTYMDIAHLEIIEDNSHNNISTSWGRTYVVFKTPNNAEFYYWKPFIYGKGDATVWVANFQCEEGNKPSDWTPPIEEVQSQIDNVDSKVQTTNNKVASIETNLNSITSRVSATESNITTTTNKLNSLQVGGTNLLLSSALPITNNNYGIQSYRLTEQFEVYKTYTLSVCVTPGTGVNYIKLYTNDGYYNLCTLDISGTAKQVVTASFMFKGYHNDNGKDHVTIYRLPNDGTTSDSTIHWIKLEKGNKATDWSPAPQDMETTVSNLTTRVSTAEQKITDSAIVSTVTSSQTYKNGLNGKVSTNQVISSINQTAEAIKISANKLDLTGELDLQGRFKCWKSNTDKTGNYLHMNGAMMFGYNKTGGSNPVFASGLWTDENMGYFSVGYTRADVTDSNGCLWLSPQQGNTGCRLTFSRLVNSSMLSTNLYFQKDGAIDFIQNLRGYNDTDDNYTYRFDSGVSTRALRCDNLRTYNIYPRYTGSSDIGSASMRYKDIFADSLSTTNSQLRLGTVTSTGAWQTYGALNINSSTGYVYPDKGNGQLSLGTNGNRFSSIYLVNSPSVSSDERLKTDIHYLDEPMPKEPIIIDGRVERNMKLTTKDMYDFVKDDLKLASYRYNLNLERGNTSTDYGFIAQDILYTKVGSEIVQIDDKEDVDSTLSYNQGNYIATLAGALQEAIKKIEVLESKIKELESK